MQGITCSEPVDNLWVAGVRAVEGRFGTRDRASVGFGQRFLRARFEALEEYWRPLYIVLFEFCKTRPSRGGYEPHHGHRSGYFEFPGHHF